MSTWSNDDTTVTLHAVAWRYLGIMKTFHYFALVVLTLASAVAQEEKGLEELLREALFEEEASQNLPLAAKGYEKLLEVYQTQRDFAATALFRLAEVRRKQDRPEAATKLYQRLLAEFPTHDPLARLSRENLVAMGADIPTTEKALGLLDEETQEIERLRKVIEASPDLISDLDKEAYAPIHRAAKNGQLRVLKFLLDRGVDVNHETKQGTALSIAALHGHLKACEFLIENKADIERASPLGEAIVSGYQHVGKFLLEKGADSNAVAVLKARWAQSGDSSIPMTMLSLAVKRRGEPFVKLLLENGADVNKAAGEEGWNPLLLAVRYGYGTMYEILIEAGADLNVQLETGESALHLLYTKEMSKRHLEPLLAAGVNLDLVDKKGNTALHYAVNAGGNADKLIEAGATVDIVNSGGLSPLDLAIRKGNLEVVNLLLSKGAEMKPDVRSCLEQSNSPRLRTELSRSKLYPTWDRKKSIILSVPEHLYHTSLATGEGEVLGLADLLLAWEAPPEGNVSSRLEWRAMKIFRRGAIIPTKIEYGTPLPALEWGDVIEVATDWERRNVGSKSKLLGSHEMEHNFSDLLETMRTFPITLRIGGKSHELILGGGVKMYNPLIAKAPNVPLDSLVGLLGVAQGSLLRLERQDGTVFEATLGEENAKFQLESGDDIRVTPPTKPSKAIRFHSPGLLFGTEYWVDSISLIQFLAYQYRTIDREQVRKMVSDLNVAPAEMDPKLISKFVAGNSRIHPQAILPCPDWSSLRVRRGETVIPVNLREAIDQCDESTTTEAVRKWDMALQAGDIVELGMLADRPKESWGGFSPATARFFEKALSREVFYQDKNNVVRALSLRYLPSLYRDTSIGLVPVPSRLWEEGEVSDPRFRSVAKSFYSSLQIVRNGEVITDSGVWPEAGDRIMMKQEDLTKKRAVILPPQLPK